MTFARAVITAVVLSLVAAGIVALVSRTPASIRLAEPAASSTVFTDAQVARHGAYRGPLYLAFFLGLAVEVVLLMILRGRAMNDLATWIESLRGGWPVHAAAIGAVIAASIGLVAVPMGFVRGYAIQKAWGLSNQDATAWVLDQTKAMGVSVVIAAIAAAAFFGVVRWQPRWWWLWGAGAFAALTTLLVFLFPVVIAPLFNTFTPLDDGALARRIETLADDAGVTIDQVLVADASKRSTAENAYVAGLGSTKQVVLYDTLIEGHDENETMFVVAHEFGHEIENHVPKSIAASAVGLLVGFAALAWLVTSGRLLAWAGVDRITDIRTLPALLLFALVATVVLQPAQNALSRSFEAKADEIAFELTGDPASAAEAFRRLAITNIADLRPHRLAVWMFYTHPPMADRIEAARASTVLRP